MQILNRSDRSGLWINVGVAIVTVVALNGIIFSLGWNQSNDTPIEPSFAPPGWVIGAIWVVLFGLMGAARWLLARRGDAAGIRGSWWVVALMAACLIYPFYTISPGSTQRALIGNLVTLVIALAAIAFVRRASTTATALVVPVALWLAFAAVLTVRILQLNV